MDNMEDKILTLEEVSSLLKISKSTIYKLSQRKKIPSIKIGKQLRFRQSSLREWFSKQENFSLEPVKSDTFVKDKSDKSSQILLIDDDPTVLKTLSRFLESKGYIVEPASSGEEALKKVEKTSFDLIVTDVRMPGIDGIETIKRIREFNNKENRQGVPEVVITGYMDSEAESKAKNLGISDYIYKPFLINEFIQTISKKIAS